MRAVILAGGKGKRLMPYTAILPKPLMPVGDRPILEIIILQLKRCGFTHITMAVGHLASLIQTFFGDGSRWGVKIDYSIEDSPLGTAGPIGLIDDLSDDFLVINGDILTDLNFALLMEQHKQSGAMATVSSYEKKVEITLGILETEQNRVTKYIEKPTLTYRVSMGVYAMNVSVLTYITKGAPLDFPDLFTSLVAADERVMSYDFDGVWFDIGRVEDYEEAVVSFQAHTNIFLT
ncbi:MAG: NTP transferase domain-containing protein [Deltaproteobacteria bacterium]|nr:NTP transferase domain-containing protein [Candidatus Zymogenaceae bacterium]